MGIVFQNTIMEWWIIVIQALPISHCFAFNKYTKLISRPMSLPLLTITIIIYGLTLNTALWLMSPECSQCSINDANGLISPTKI